MPYIFENICKICQTAYRGYGHTYCSAKCRLADKELKDRMLMNRTGKRRPPTAATKKKISQSLKRWYENVDVSQETRNKHSANSRGPCNWHWKGGEIKMGKYWYIWQPHHLRGNKRRYVKRSILVAERHLGRFLNREEIIHHIDSNPANDSPNNLYLFPNKTGHLSFHFTYQGIGLKGKKPPYLDSNLFKHE